MTSKLLEGLLERGQSVKVSKGEQYRVELVGYPKAVRRSHSLEKALGELLAYVDFCEENSVELGQFFEGFE